MIAPQGLGRLGREACRRRLHRHGGQAGQSVVEFTLVMPVLLLLLVGMLEFGSVFDHKTAMAYAVREGARVGASLGNGGSNPGMVDTTIVTAVRRGLTNPILIENITSIEIYKADPNGDPEPGKVDTYDRDGTLVGTQGWPATQRVVGNQGDSIGVRVRYDFHPTTPLATLLGLFAGSAPPYVTLPMTDRTVMRLEPTP